MSHLPHHLPRPIVALVAVLVAVALAFALAGTTSAAAADPRSDPASVRPGDSHRVAPAERRAAEPVRLPSRRSGVHLYDCDAVGPGGQCGTLRVPLDRAHPGRAQLTLFFLYYRHRRPGPSREAIMLSEGGPGYSITNTEFEKQNYKDVFDPLLDTRDLVMFDQRGVGRSGALTCRALQRNPDFSLASILTKFARCAQQLGTQATVYGSGDVALDMEALRRALGIEKLDLYGGSYAAQDVQSYTLRFPHRVRTAVLDSPFSASVFGHPGQTFDDFLTDIALDIPAMADRLCARSVSCSIDRSNAHDDLAWLVHRLRASPVSGTAVDLLGRPQPVTVTERTLAWRVLTADDFNLIALSEAAAAAAALRAGDPAPLLRLGAEAATDTGPGEPDPVEIFSMGDNAARSCVDLEFPWDTSASLGKRRVQWQQAVDALPQDQFGIWSKRAWLSKPGSPVAPDACIVWPGPERTTPAAVPAGSSFSARVPALVISGDLDRSIPAADALALHRIWPGSSYVEIQNAQHHVWFTAPECAQSIIVRFVTTKQPGDTSCAASNDELFSYPAVGRFPVLAAGAVPATPAPGDASTPTDRLVVSAATSAVTDAFRRGFGPVTPEQSAGLRGGTFTLAFGDTAANETLTAVRFTTDVAVSGESSYTWNAQLLEASVTVDGPGAEDGELQISGVWYGFGVTTTVLQVTGTIGGRQVSVTTPAS